MAETNNSKEDSFFCVISSDKRDNWKLHHALKIKGFKDYSSFASVCGFSRSFISKVIHRHIKPTLAQAQKISGKLDLSIFDLFEKWELRDLNEVMEVKK